MEKESRKFLEDLLATPGPAGAEMEAQRVWKKYAENFSDRIDVDNMGNVTGVINPDAKFRIMLAGHIDEIGFIIKRIDDKGFLYVDKVGGISHKIAPGMKVEILGFNGKLTGVIGANAQHHGGLKDDFSFEDLYIDCGAKCKEDMDKIVRLGDFAVYKRETEFLLNNRISGKALDNRTGAFVVAEVLKRLYEDRPTVGVYCSSTVSEEIGLHGAYFAASAVNPDIAIACDVTFATDYPGVNKDKYGDYHLGKGPVLAVGSPINRKMNSFSKRAQRSWKSNFSTSSHRDQREPMPTE